MNLADTLITLAVTTIILGLFVGIYFGYTSLFTVQNTYRELNTESSIFLDKVSQSIRSANSVMDNQTINATAYTMDQHTLILKIPSIDASDDVIAGSFDYAVYYLNPSDSTQVLYDLEPNIASVRDSVSGKLVMENAENLIFNYSNTTIADIDEVETIVVLTKSVSTYDPSLTVQSTSQLRN